VAGPLLRVWWDNIGDAIDLLGGNRRAFQLWLCMLAHANWRTGKLDPKNATLMKAARTTKEKFHRDEQLLIKLGMLEVSDKIGCGRYTRRIPAKFLKESKTDDWSPDGDGVAEGFEQ
jgi:hypothetical protein